MVKSNKKLIKIKSKKEDNLIKLKRETKLKGKTKKFLPGWAGAQT
jgi:hypothetical protein